MSKCHERAVQLFAGSHKWERYIVEKAKLRSRGFSEPAASCQAIELARSNSVL